jgi:rod shape-determining protein MreC
VNFKKYRDIAIVVLALAVPFWFLRASMKDPRQATGADRIVVQIAAPIQQAVTTLARGISDMWGDYVYLVDVKQNNAELVSQNARLSERVRELEPLEVENRRLRRDLDLKNDIEDEVVTAQVIGKNTNEFFRMMRLTLDKSSPGLRPDLPVLSPDGVVGITQKVAGDTIDVRLIADSGAGVDVVVERTQAPGKVIGTGDEREYRCQVEYVKRTDEVAVGDVLVTTGIGATFPKGHKVCTVSKVTKNDFGVYQQLSCVPTVDFSRLSEVLVVISKRQPIPPPAKEAREP